MLDEVDPSASKIIPSSCLLQLPQSGQKNIAKLFNDTWVYILPFTIIMGEHLSKEKKYKELFLRKYEFSLLWIDPCFQFPYKNIVKDSNGLSQLDVFYTIVCILLSRIEWQQGTVLLYLLHRNRWVKANPTICKNLLVNINKIFQV